MAQKRRFYSAREKKNVEEKFPAPAEKRKKKAPSGWHPEGRGVSGEWAASKRERPASLERVAGRRGGRQFRSAVSRNTAESTSALPAQPEKEKFSCQNSQTQKVASTGSMLPMIAAFT